VGADPYIWGLVVGMKLDYHTVAYKMTLGEIAAGYAMMDLRNAYEEEEAKRHGNR